MCGGSGVSGPAADYSAEVIPPGQPRERETLQSSDRMQFAGERLLAGLVAEHLPARIGARRSADKGKLEQRGLGNAAGIGLRQHLVDPERREGDEVDRDQIGRDIRGGEEGEQVHRVGARGYNVHGWASGR